MSLPRGLHERSIAASVQATLLVDATPAIMMQHAHYVHEVAVGGVVEGTKAPAVRAIRVGALVEECPDTLCAALGRRELVIEDRVMQRSPFATVCCCVTRWEGG